MIRNHIHKQSSFIDRAVGAAELGGKIYGGLQTLYHVGRAVGTVARIAAPLLL
jgi:hypothetical protein